MQLITVHIELSFYIRKQMQFTINDDTYILSFGMVNELSAQIIEYYCDQPPHAIFIHLIFITLFLELRK